MVMSAENALEVKSAEDLPGRLVKAINGLGKIASPVMIARHKFDRAGDDISVLWGAMRDQALARPSLNARRMKSSIYRRAETEIVERSSLVQDYGVIFRDKITIIPLQLASSRRVALVEHVLLPRREEEGTGAIDIRYMVWPSPKKAAEAIDSRIRAAKSALAFGTHFR